MPLLAHEDPRVSLVIQSIVSNQQELRVPETILWKGWHGSDADTRALALRYIIDRTLGDGLGNIKIYDEKVGGNIIRTIYAELVNLWFLERLLP